MNNNSINKFRQLLNQRKHALLTWEESESEDKKDQLCDPSICGSEEIVTQCNQALNRIENGKFGKCTECGQNIEPERLELNFTTCVCLDHYSESQKRILERDLELTAKMQRQLLPHTLPTLNSIQIAAHTEPAQVVGGDYFDFFDYPGGEQGVVIADIMGKGISASMLVSSLQTSLRILGPEYPSLHSLAKRLNDLFIYNTKMISFISIFLLRIDEKTKKIYYCNAGHNPAIWWQATTKKIHWLEPTGPAIGLTKNALFKSKEFTFSSEDLLLLYTDGLVEAHDSQDNEFGKTCLVNYVEKNLHYTASDFLSGLRNRVKNFAGRFHDDVTIIVIKAK